MEAIIDYRGKTPEKTSFGIPLITAKIVKDGQINNIQEYIAIKDYDSWMRRGLPEPGDIVMTTEAPLGEIAQLDNRKVALGQRLITLRGNPTILNNNYLKFLMQSFFVQNQLHERATGTTVLGIKQSELRKINLVIPPLSEQKAIAHILSSLDDKIELNRQMNETLEAMAKAIFKSWFVDFDPVSAKRSGRQPAGMDTATADLFPDEFEESSLGLIPKGWRVGKLGDLGKIVTGKTPSTKVAEYFGGNVPFITPSDMDGKKTISRTARYLTEDGVNAVKSAKIPAGSIMVSCIGSDMGKVACTVQDSVTNQQINSIIANDYSREYIYYNLSQRKEELQNLAGGGSAVPILNKGHFSNIEILIPDIYLLKQFDNFSNTFTKKIYENDEESHILATLRDTLLPKLMSGEIRVKEAEKIMEKLT
ncbi:MAG: restriction endonuclease subunit S [Anabaena sp. 49628_E55]|nr:restriction endonuclease subunit S [Anabaena sp. 49628_E55]